MENKNQTKKTAKKDQSQKVHQDPKVDFDIPIKERTDYTEKQIEILKHMVNKDTKCVFLDGLWGTGKTALAVLSALKNLKNKKSDGIIYIRNPVESSSTGKIGFLKGEADEKMRPYNEIAFALLDELVSKSMAQKLLDEKWIECLPLGFIRGRTWNAKTIIVDEASSMTYEDILLIMTRCGEHTKIYFTGDAENQNDIGSKAGFRKMFEKFSDQESKDNGIFTFELKDEADIVRSGFVRFILKKLGKIKM